MKYEKICPVCGKTFTTNNEIYMYCSPECRADARRKREREYRRAERASKRPDTVSEEFRRARAEEAEERSRQYREDFERRCAEGDVHALLIREKMLHGNSSRRFWKLFAQCSIDDADRAGTVSRVLVNGFSVYEDDFAGKVLESIKTKGHIFTELSPRRK